MTWNPDYISVDDARDWLHVGDANDDTEIALWVTTASRAVDKHCNRQFGLLAAPAERLYTAWFDYDVCAWVVDIDDLMDSTGFTLSVDGTAVTSGGYRLEPVNAPADDRPWTRLVFLSGAEAIPDGTTAQVSATGLWGWSAVPSAVQLGTRVQVGRFAVRRDSPYGIAGSPADGSEMRLLAKLDPDVAVSLTGFRRARMPR